MEQTIKYISDNPTIQDEIINSGNPKVIIATYHLLLHENCSLEYYLKSLFRKGFESSGIYIFRENNIEINIINDFIKKYGGNFSTLSKELAQLAYDESTAELKVLGQEIQETQENAKIRMNEEKQVASKAFDLIEKLLILAMTDAIIDFCAYICRFLNSYYKNTNDPLCGEKQICSFVIFNIVSPAINDCPDIKYRAHLLQLITILKTISLGDNNNYIVEYERIRSIIAYILMKQKNTQYVQWYHLSTEDYNQRCVILLAYLKNSHQCENIENTEQTQKSIIKNVNIPKSASDPIKSSKSKKISNDSSLVSKNYKSWDNLMNITSVSTEKKSPRNNIKYFLLSTLDEVLDFARADKLDVDFLSKWKIDGKNFVHLTKDVMLTMGLSDKNEMDKILKSIDYIKHNAISSTPKLKKHITHWTCQDLCLWLIFVNMDYLVDIFVKNNIGCIKLLTMDNQSYLNYGITKPADIAKLETRKKLMLMTV